MARALERMTVEEFQDWADARPGETYELVEGEPRLMAGPGAPHAELQAALIMAIGSRVRPPCRILGQVGLVLNRFNEHVPDIAVHCGPRGETRLTTATAVIEILSPSTAADDYGPKKLRYMQLEGLQEIWLVASDRRQIELWRRHADGHWLGQSFQSGEAVTSDLLREPLPLDPLYDGIGL